MAHEPRSDIKKAQETLVELLNTPLHKIIHDPEILELLVGKAAEESDFHDFFNPRSKCPTGLNTENMTVRHYLGWCAHRYDDPFIMEKSRAAAKQQHPDEYRKRLQQAAGLNQDIATLPNVLEKWLCFLDATIELADEGKRPPGDAIRKGITVLQHSIRAHKKNEPKALEFAASASTLEDVFYTTRANAILFAIKEDIGRKLLGKDFQPLQDLHQGEYADIPEALLKNIRNSKLEDLHNTKNDIVTWLKARHPIQADDYRKNAYYMKKAASFNKICAATELHIVQALQKIANDLGIDINSRHRHNS